MQLKTKDAAHDIAKIIFRGDNFKDEAAVNDWLKAGGYEGVTVVKHDDGSFSVTDAEAPTDGLVEVEKDGVTVYVYQKQEAAAKAAAIAAEGITAEGSPSNITSANGQSVQPVAKTEGEEGAAGAAAEPVVAKEGQEGVAGAAAAPAAGTEGQAAPVVVAEGAAAAVAAVEALKTESLEVVRKKFDEWDVMYSDELTFADALADGFDGIPPGFGEVITAVYAATRNAIIMGNHASIGQIFADAATLVQKLAAIFPADVPMTLDLTVALDDERLSAYVVKEEGKEPVLDEVRLRGDLYFPEVTIADPVLVGGAQKLPEMAEGTRQKRDMSYKRKAIVGKQANKNPNAGTQNDGNASDGTANGANSGADANGANAKPKKKDEGDATNVVNVAGPSAEAIAAAVAAAMAPAITAMTGLVDTVKASAEEAKKQAQAQVEAVQKSAQEAIEAVNAAKVERQTRKSADADETNAGTQTTAEGKRKTASKEVAQMRLRGAMGMPAPRR
jgi:hypothetical protein